MSLEHIFKVRFCPRCDDQRPLSWFAVKGKRGCFHKLCQECRAATAEAGKKRLKASESLHPVREYGKLMYKAGFWFHAAIEAKRKKLKDAAKKAWMYHYYSRNQATQAVLKLELELAGVGGIPLSKRDGKTGKLLPYKREIDEN